MNSILQHLSSKVDDLSRHINSDESDWFRYELRMLATLVLVQVGRTLNLGETCRRLENLAFPKCRSLDAAAVAMRRDFARGTSIRLRSGCRAYPHRLIDDIESAINAIDLARVDVNTRLDARATLVLNIEAKLQVLLACYAERGLPPAFLQQSVREALMAVGEKSTYHIWQSIRRELEGDRERDACRGAVAHCVRDRNFDSLCAYISEYLTSPRPERMTRLAGNWDSLVESMLDAVPGLAIVITWKDQSLAEHPSIPEQALGHSLARVDELMRTLYNMPPEDIAGMVGVRSLRVVHLVRPTSPRDPAVGAAEQLVYGLRDLLRNADPLAQKDSSVFHWVRQYKLILETRAPDLFDALKEQREDRFRRDLAAFLRGRDFPVVGTLFASSATDLHVAVDSRDHVLEVKIVRRALSPAKLKGHLVQLYHYLGQQNPHALGILLVYNFTEVSIVASDELVGGRTLVVPINLHPNPPSRRKKALLVRPGLAGDLIDVVEAGARNAMN